MIARLMLLATAGLLLSGCDRAGRCKPPTETKAVAAPVGPSAAAAPYGAPSPRAASDEARACVQRYAWKYSKSREETPVVAQAAVTACDAFIAAATEVEAGGPESDGRRDLNAIHEANIQAMTRWATLYVVQYRARVCD